MASVLLKKYVKEHWKSFGKDFVSPEVNPQEKDEIKNRLLPLLADNHSKIRTTVAMVISNIAYWEWPEEWPSFLNSMIGAIRSSNTNLVLGAIKVLEVFATPENFTEETVSLLVQTLFPHLQEIYLSQNTIWVQTKILGIITSSLSYLVMVDKSETKQMRKALAQILPQWLSEAARLLHQTEAAPLKANWSVKVAALQLTTLVFQDFPALAKEYLKVLVPQAWASLVRSLPVYNEGYINCDANSSEVEEGQEDETEYFDSFVSELLSFFLVLLETERSRLRTLLADQLPNLCYFLIAFMSLTTSQVILFLDDPNEFVAEEEEEEFVSNNFSVRSAAWQLLETAVEAFKDKGLNALLSAVSRTFQDAENLRATQNPSWWKRREAGLQALGIVLRQMKEEGILGLDVGALLSSVLTCDIEARDLPYLRGRALWLASRFSEQLLSSEYSRHFLHAAVSSLHSSTDPLPVKISACCAISNFCSTKPDIARWCVNDIIEGLCRLLRETSERVLHHILDTFILSLKAKQTWEAEQLQRVVGGLLESWQKSWADPLLADQLRECFEQLAEYSESLPLLVSLLLPRLTSILSTPNSLYSGVVDTAIQLLTVLLKRSEGAMAEQIVRQTFGQLTNIVLSLDEATLVASGTLALSLSVEKAAPLLSNFFIDETSAPSLLLRVGERLMVPSLNESFAVNAGFFLEKLLLHLFSSVQQILPQLLHAVILRLLSAESSSLIMGLLEFCGLLAHSDAEMFVKLVGAIHLPPHPEKGERVALYELLSLWTKWNHSLPSSFGLKIGTVGLALLTQVNSEILRSMRFVGNDSSFDAPRLVDFRVRVVEVLLDVYKSKGQNEEDLLNYMGGASEEDEEDEGDEEDDELELAEGSSPFAPAEDYEKYFENEDEDSLLFDNKAAVSDIAIQSHPVFSVDVKVYIHDFVKRVVSSDVMTGLLPKHQELARKLLE
eukprot:TRINITY_DN331_c0_g1_i4.p1 TRINITY_DN331_c0_g1~~TRINITY_DN331_c0_g1_i4.p1  ORF type:complete len:953 (-),score=187.82 TRINITY_DN331_c0_g1_i4:31-2889(-)